MVLTMAEQVPEDQTLLLSLSVYTVKDTKMELLKYVSIE